MMIDTVYIIHVHMYAFVDYVAFVFFANIVVHFCSFITVKSFSFLSDHHECSEWLCQTLHIQT